MDLTAVASVYQSAVRQSTVYSTSRGKTPTPLAACPKPICSAAPATQPPPNERRTHPCSPLRTLQAVPCPPAAVSMNKKCEARLHIHAQYVCCAYTCAHAQTHVHTHHMHTCTRTRRHTHALALAHMNKHAHGPCIRVSCYYVATCVCYILRKRAIRKAPKSR